MDQERNEVYERIPWEMLERKGADRQWIMFVAAGAIVAGALAYSFVSNRPPTPSPVVSTLVAAQSPVAPSTVAVPDSAPGLPPADAVVISEADLYAVEPDRLMRQASAHAEFFMAEYFTVDGAEEESSVLGGLLPPGLPVPRPDTGERVFVEWARATEIEEVEPFRYRVTVLVRYLVAIGESPYERRPPVSATVEVTVDERGPRIVLPPSIEPAAFNAPEPLQLGVVPDEIAQMALAGLESAKVIGGVMTADGRWQVVVFAPGPDGVDRPQTVSVP